MVVGDHDSGHFGGGDFLGAVGHGGGVGVLLPRLRMVLSAVLALVLLVIVETLLRLLLVVKT